MLPSGYSKHKGEASENSVSSLRRPRSAFWSDGHPDRRQRVPDFLNASSGFSSTFLTTVFWTCLSGLFMLAAISLGIIAEKLINKDSAA